MSFKERLRELRQNKTLSQQELANKIFVSRSTVAKWENGLGIPNDSNLKALCDFFEVEEDWLLDRQDLKASVNFYRTEKMHRFASIAGMLTPFICFILSLNKVFTQPSYVDSVWPPVSIFNILDVCASDIFFGFPIIVVPFFIWMASFVFALVSLCANKLKRHARICLWINVICAIICILILVGAFFLSVYIFKPGNFEIFIFK